VSGLKRSGGDCQIRAPVVEERRRGVQQSNRSHRAEFKARIALEAIKGRKTAIRF
jgi:hypothetical protein